MPSWLFDVVPTEAGSFILLVDVAAGKCMPSEISEIIIKTIYSITMQLMKFYSPDTCR